MGVSVHFTYPDQGPEFAIPRYLLAALAVGWNQQIIEECGRHIVLLDGTYHTYRTHITINSWAWSFSSKTVRMRQLFEDWYTLDGSGHDIGDYAVSLQWGFPRQQNYPIVFATIPGWIDPWVTWHPLPPSNPSYRQPAWITTYPECITTDT